MNFLYVLVLSVVQGITEFLPISSSGHLAVLGTLFQFNPDENLALGIVLHAGTLVAIVIFYFRELLRFFRAARLRLALMVIVGSIPAGVVGLVLSKCGRAGDVFGNQALTGVGFLLTATLLMWSSRRCRRSGDQERVMPIEAVEFRQALLVGVAQAVAILPGVSRSGATISIGLLAGMHATACAEFSFLLAVPAIGGAALLEFLDLAEKGVMIGGVTPWQLAAGFLVSAAVGYVTLSLLVRMLNRGKLGFFAWYLYVIGIGVLAWQLI